MGEKLNLLIDKQTSYKFIKVFLRKSKVKLFLKIIHLFVNPNNFYKFGQAN